MYQGVVNVCCKSSPRVTPPTYRQFLRTFHAPYEACYRRLGVTASPDEIWQWYEEATLESEAEVFPDVLPVLDHLTTEFNVVSGIITARSAAPVRKKCEEAGIANHLSFLIGGVPDKVPSLMNVCKTTGIDPGRMWFVGDTISDMRDGRIAGVRCVGITRGNQVADVLLEAGAEVCIENLDELSELIYDNKRAFR